MMVILLNPKELKLLLIVSVCIRMNLIKVRKIWHSGYNVICIHFFWLGMTSLALTVDCHQLT